MTTNREQAVKVFRTLANSKYASRFAREVFEEVARRYAAMTDEEYEAGLLLQAQRNKDKRK